MKTHHSTAFTHSALMIGIMILALAACRKSPNTIGNNLLDDNNYIGVYHTDTITVEGYSYITDSVNTQNSTYALLGSLNDPVFGLTQAGFYTQFHLSSSGQNFGVNPSLDSLVLQLCIGGYYGDTTTVQTVHAYQLTEPLADSNSYYNFSEVAHDLVDCANGFQFCPHPYTSTNIVGTDTVQHAILRIPLSQELGDYLIHLDSTAYSEPDVFKENMNGLYLTCDAVSQNGSVTSVSLTNNTYTLLQIYYHNEDTPDKAMRYDLYVTSADTYFNHFEHDYQQGSPEFVQQVLEGDTTLGSQTLYLQTMAGVRAKLRFPYLKHLADTLEDAHIVINEAKLILPASPLADDTVVFTTPTSYVLVGFNADETTFLLPDYYEGTSYFGGSYSTASQSVWFRISEYFQDVVTGRHEDYGLSLGINGAAYNAQRWIINGPGQEEDKLHVEMTYSIVGE